MWPLRVTGTRAGCMVTPGPPGAGRLPVLKCEVGSEFSPSSVPASNPPGEGPGAGGLGPGASADRRGRLCACPAPALAIHKAGGPSLSFRPKVQAQGVGGAGGDRESTPGPPPASGAPGSSRGPSAVATSLPSTCHVVFSHLVSVPPVRTPPAITAHRLQTASPPHDPACKHPVLR